jgi:hypothetical protein
VQETVQDQFGGIGRRSAVREVVGKQRLTVGRRLRNEGSMTVIWLGVITDTGCYY